MPDDPAPDRPAPPRSPAPPEVGARGRWARARRRELLAALSRVLEGPWLARRSLWLAIACVIPCAVIAIDVAFILRARGQSSPAGSASAAAVASSAPSAAPEPSLTASATAAAIVPQPVEPLKLDAGEPPVFDEEGEDERGPRRETPPKHFATVEQAVAGSCTTGSVEGLSRQIIEQARCLNPRGFVELPKRPNLQLKSHVFPYLEAGARDHLLRALAAHPKATLTVNSALRTVVQQYMVWRWSANKRCGVQLATLPGDSNHELGLALDVANAAAWRPALEAEKFRWLGSSDRVHFDYKGKNPPTTATDVLAFQKLWNKNHPKDRIAETGRYDESMERRIKTAPADGFARGPSSCNGSRSRGEEKARR